MDAKTAHDIAYKSAYEINSVLRIIKEIAEEGKFTAAYTIQRQDTKDKLIDLGFKLYNRSGTKEYFISWENDKK